MKATSPFHTHKNGTSFNKQQIQSVSTVSDVSDKRRWSAHMSAQNLSTAIICRSPTVRSISLLWLQLAWTRPQDVKADGFSCAYLCQPNYPLIGYWMVILSASKCEKRLQSLITSVWISPFGIIFGNDPYWIIRYHIIFNIILLSYSSHCIRNTNRWDIHDISRQLPSSRRFV